MIGVTGVLDISADKISEVEHLADGDVKHALGSCSERADALHRLEIRPSQAGGADPRRYCLIERVGPIGLETLVLPSADGRSHDVGPGERDAW